MAGGRGRGRGRGNRQRGGSSSARTTQEVEEEVVMETHDESTESSDQQGRPKPIIEYTADGRIILKPDGLWFHDDKVVRGCTKSTRSKISKGITCWSGAEEEDIDDWFNAFRRDFYWKPELEAIARTRYEETCQRRFKDNMYKVAKHKTRKSPQYMVGTAYEDLMKHRATPEFKEKSIRAQINKRGGRVEGSFEPTHFGGSQSNYTRATSYASTHNGEMPPVADLFLQNHSKVDANGVRHFATARDSEIYDNYQGALANDTSNKSSNQIWFETVEGYNKGSVYGAGNAHDLYFTPPSRRRNSSTKSSQTYAPGIVSQLQQQLEEERKANQARDEEYKLMREQFAAMQTFFQQCNPGYQPPPRDDRDPGNGGEGGSGAGTAFQVS